MKRPFRTKCICVQTARTPLMPEGPCFNQIWSEILLKEVTPRRADNRVKKICREYYQIEPGYLFRDVPILLPHSMLMGIDEAEGRIVMPFRKPCFGTSLYSIETDWGEICLIRTELGMREKPLPAQRKRSGKTQKNPKRESEKR